MIIKTSHSAKAAAEELYGPFENIFLKQKVKIIFTIMILNKYIHFLKKSVIFFAPMTYIPYSLHQYLPPPFNVRCIEKAVLIAALRQRDER